MPDLEQRAVGPRAIQHGWNDVLGLRRRRTAAPRAAGRPAPCRASPAARAIRSRWVRSAWSPTFRISTGASASSTKSLTPTMVRRPRSTSAWNRIELAAIWRWNHPVSIAATTPPCASISAKKPSGLALERVGQRLDVVRAAERIGHVGRRRSRTPGSAGSGARSAPTPRWGARASRPARWCAATGCRRAPRPAPGRRPARRCSAAAARSASLRPSGSGTASASSAASRAP